jgi:hypothetical protein
MVGINLIMTVVSRLSQRRRGELTRKMQLDPSARYQRDTIGEGDGVAASPHSRH